jgi:hypothetical protein
MASPFTPTSSLRNRSSRLVDQPLVKEYLQRIDEAVCVWVYVCVRACARECGMKYEENVRIRKRYQVTSFGKMSIIKYEENQVLGKCLDGTGGVDLHLSSRLTAHLPPTPHPSPLSPQGSIYKVRCSEGSIHFLATSYIFLAAQELVQLVFLPLTTLLTSECRHPPTAMVFVNPKP